MRQIILKDWGSKLTVITILTSIMLILVFKFSVFSTENNSSEISISSAIHENPKSHAYTDTLINKLEYNKPYCFVFHGINTTDAIVNAGQFKINVYVDEISNLRYIGIIPFRRSVKIKSEVHYSWNHPLKSMNPTENGYFEIKGRYHLTGSSSKRSVIIEVKRLITQNIKSQIEKEIRLELNPD